MILLLYNITVFFRKVYNSLLNHNDSNEACNMTSIDEYHSKIKSVSNIFRKIYFGHVRTSCAISFIGDTESLAEWWEECQKL